MELGTIIGFIAGFIFLILTIVLPDFDFSLIQHYVDAASVMIVVGGAFSSLLIGYPIPKVMSALKAAKYAFKPPRSNPVEAIEQIVSLANLARKEGILALEDAASSMGEPFLKKGVMLIVDGTDPELVRNILETEMSYIESRHSEVRGFWDTMAAYAPSWGMVGTVLSLIIMLQNLDDPAAIGPAMALALITTFYGAMVANYIANPISNKLKIFSSEEMLLKEILIEGMLSIQAGENPRIIEEKLKSFLSPAMRAKAGEGNKDEAGDE